MDRWKRFVDWCQQPSKIKVRTFNPRNIMLIAFSALLISVITSGTWLYQVLSVPATTTLTRYNYETLFPTLIITEDTVLAEDYSGEVYVEADSITLDGNGHTITGPGAWKWNSTRRMWDVSQGITANGRTGVTVKNCLVTNFAYGLVFSECDGNILLNNTVYNNVWGGILVSGSSNSTILNNTAYSVQGVVNSSDVTGFGVSGSFGNTVKGNVAYDNGIGFVISGSFGNIFKGNVAFDNNWGFHILAEEVHLEYFEEDWGFVPEKTEGNIFEANTIRGNTEFGFLVMGDLSSISNTFFHNNLINNTVQAALAPAYYTHDNRTSYPVWGVSVWDDGSSGGNFWSDYEGVDADSDGIGDAPYAMPTVTHEFGGNAASPGPPVWIIGEPDGKNVDRFPLMAPFNVLDNGIEGGENHEG